MMKSLLRSPGEGVGIGLVCAIGVYLIYNDALPTVADLRTAPEHNDDAEAARKAAAWKAAGIVGLVTLATRDLNAFIIGGAAIVGTDWLFKNANAIKPGTGKMDGSGTARTIDPDNYADDSEPLPQYNG